MSKRKSKENIKSNEKYKFKKKNRFKLKITKMSKNIIKKINDLIDEVGVFEIMNQLLVRKEIIIFHYFASEDLAELWNTSLDKIQLYIGEIQNKINEYIDDDKFGFTDTILEDFKNDFEIDKDIKF